MGFTRVLGIAGAFEADHHPLTFLVPSSMTMGSGEQVTCHTLLDSGATHCFVSRRMVERTGLMTRAAHHMAIEVAGGSTVQSGRVTTLKVRLAPGHSEEIVAHVIEEVLDGVDLILGCDWLTRRSARFDFRNSTCRFQSERGTVVLRGHTTAAERPLKLSVASIKAAVQHPPLSAKQAERLIKKGAQAVLVMVSKKPGQSQGQETRHEGMRFAFAEHARWLSA